MDDLVNVPILYYIDRLLIMVTAFLSAFIMFANFKGLYYNIKQKTAVTIICIMLPLFWQLLGGIGNVIIKLLYILSMCVMLILFGKNKKHFSIPTAIVSVALSLCIQYISAFLSGSLLFFTRFKTNKLWITVVACVIQLTICILLSHINKLKKCFSYFEQEAHFGLGLLLSSYILLFSLLLSQPDYIGITKGIVLLAVCPLVLTGFILWVGSIVNNHFKRRIADRADAFTQQEIKEKDERIEQLEAEVATLAKQVHRDNHLLSSLDRSVQTLAETESAAEREQLADEFRTLYRERNDLIAKEQQERKLLPSTGVALIDGALSEMYVKATAHGIHFDLMVGEPIHYLVNNIISQTDLQTLLCDHIKDAIIAVDAAKGESGKILVSIEKHEGLFEITIRDNGVDFTPETLAKLGKERVTTHAEEGGSGIGFMTTFETLEKTKGSLIITEHESKTPFSKSVAFVFDGLHQFIISSYRRDELKEKLSRDDILYL